MLLFELRPPCHFIQTNGLAQKQEIGHVQETASKYQCLHLATFNSLNFRHMLRYVSFFWLLPMQNQRISGKRCWFGTRRGSNALLGFGCLDFGVNLGQVWVCFPASLTSGCHQAWQLNIPHQRGHFSWRQPKKTGDFPAMFDYQREPDWWFWELISGWWFGTFFVFPYIGYNHPNWLIFFRGVQTTNQIHTCTLHVFGWILPANSLWHLCWKVEESS